MASGKPLTVAIDGRIAAHTEVGGWASVLIGLVGGLGELSDGEETYLVLVYEESQDWLRPYVGPNTRLVAVPRPKRQRLLASVSAVLPWARTLRQMWRTQTPPVLRFPRSDGTIERLGVDVMHFTTEAFETAIPNIYQPHDLQHLHLPDFFSPAEVAMRSFLKDRSAAQATEVIAAASWTRQDLIRNMNLPPEKVRVVPMGPPNDRYAIPDEAAVQECRRRLGLPDGFAYYPAAFWPHKNHLALMEALALLRDRDGLVIPFVSSGHTGKAHFAKVQDRVAALGLGDQVRFLGFVNPGDLQSLYQLSTLTVIPTKFEAGSFPMWEAFLAGTPVACSTVTSLPDQAAGAALLFDPDDIAGMADAMARLWTDPALRAKMVAHGRARVGQFSWSRTARHFRAVYRHVAGRALDAHDTEILSADPLW